MKSNAMSDEALGLVARRFAVLSDPLRLRLVHSLFEGERNVTQLVALTKGTQANVSRHLQTLAASGILGRRKEGLMVYYYLLDPSILQLCELVCGSLSKQLTTQMQAFAGPSR